MMRVGRRAAFAVGVGAALVGLRCSPFDELPADGRPAPEAGADSGPTTGDAGGVGMQPVDAGPTACGSRYTTCDDFERRDPPFGGPFGWRAGGGSRVASIRSPTSTPSGRTLLFEMPGGEEAFVETDVPRETRRLRIGFRMRLEADMPLTHLVSVAFEEGHFAILEVVGGDFHLGEQDTRPDPDINHISWAAGAMAGWARYELEVALDDKLITLHRDGVKLGDKVITLDLAVPTTLRLGITYNDVAERAYDVEFDDVGLALEP